MFCVDNQGNLENLRVPFSFVKEFFHISLCETMHQLASFCDNVRLGVCVKNSLYMKLALSISFITSDICNYLLQEHQIRRRSIALGQGA